MDTDRRDSLRKPEEISIKILFGRDSLRDEPDLESGISAKIRNHSSDGFYMKTDRLLEPGATIRIKMVAPEDDCSEGACFIYDCQVVWHEKFDDRTRPFGIGVRILRRNVQAYVPSSSCLLSNK